MTCASGAFATEWNVSTVAALTNAVTQAMPGDRIILAQGKYTFTDEWMQDDGTGKNLLVITNDNITIEGAVETPRSTWTDQDEPVIVDGNGLGSIIKVDQSNRPNQNSARNRLTLKHITFTGATYKGAAFADGVTDAKYDFVKCTNCVFRQNTCSIGSVTAVSNWGELRDCLVTNNVTTTSSYVLRNANAHGCDIVGNSGGKLWNAVCAFGCKIAINDSSAVSNGYMCDKGSRGTCENCDFRENYSSRGIIGYFDFLNECLFEDNTNTYGYALFVATAATNCTFRRNMSTALESSIAQGFKSLYNCTFEENQAGKGIVYLYDNGIDAVAEGCTFVSNKLYNRGQGGNGGGGIKVVRDASHLCTMYATNCTFKWNSQLTGGYLGGAICATNSVSGEAPWAAVTAIDCTFSSNKTSKASGVLGVYAKKCRFAGNSNGANNTYNNTAWLSRLEDCDIHGGGLADCVADRCRIHDAPAGNVDERGEFCVFAGRTSATNCLVERCDLNLTFGCLYFVGTGYQMDAEFVNCTFATNKMYTFRYEGNCSATNGVRFVNCLFNGNFNNYTSTDFGTCYSTSSSPHPEWLESYSFVNAYYGKFTAGSGVTADQFANITNAPNTLALCADPKFAKDGYSAAPYWSLMYNSPLVGKGDTLDFSAGDFDLAGRPRLRDGRIDIGCYECWLNPPGFMLLVR